MGGMARRATKINQVRNEGTPVIVLEGGGFTGPADELRALKFEAMLSGFERMGYDGIAIGIPEILMLAADGHKAWEALKSSGLPVTTLNLSFNGNVIAEKPLIIKRDGIRVAAFSLLLGEAIPEGLARYWHMEAPDRVIKRALPYLRRNSDFTIAFLYGTRDQVDQFVARHTGMDIVVDAMNRRPVFNPRRVNDALMLSAGDRGQYLGRIDARVVDGRWAFEATLVPLTRSVKEDAKLKGVYEVYVKRLRDMFRGREEDAVMQAKTDLPPMPTAEDCLGCHEEIYKQWKKTRHAEAILSLRNRNQDYNPECLPCHAVGYEHGGFTSLSRTPEYGGVQCISCHGNMEEHMNYHEGLLDEEPSAPQEVTEAVCLYCHTVQRDGDFVFERDKKQVHP
jgi:hypothetical protein